MLRARRYHCKQNETARRRLLQAGWQVDEAVNGVEAIEKSLLAPYDLYLVDVNMPKLDGYAFLRELRSQPIPQAPAIMASSLLVPGRMTVFRMRTSGSSEGR